MPEQPINLSAHQVQQLLEQGECEWRRACATGALAPHHIGERLWGRESVYKPRKGETGYLYRADGEQPGRYPQRNYHMPRAACRLQLVVVQGWVDYQGEQQEHCFTLRPLPNG